MTIVRTRRIELREDWCWIAAIWHLWAIGCSIQLSSVSCVLLEIAFLESAPISLI
jgi:hypothetical protein